METTRIEKLPSDIFSNILDKLISLPSTLGGIIETISPILEVYGGSIEKIIENSSIWLIITEKLKISISPYPSPPQLISRYNGLLETKYFTDPRPFICYKEYRIITEEEEFIFLDNYNKKYVIEKPYFYQQIDCTDEYLMIEEHTGDLKIEIWKDAPWKSDKVVDIEVKESSYVDYFYVYLQEAYKGTLLICVMNDDIEYKYISNIKKSMFIGRPDKIGYYGIYERHGGKLMIKGHPSREVILPLETYNLEFYGSHRGIDILRDTIGGVFYVYDSLSDEFLWGFDENPSFVWDFIYCENWVRDLRTGIILFNPRDYGSNAVFIKGITRKEDNSGFYVWIHKDELRNDVIEAIDRRELIH